MRKIYITHCSAKKDDSLKGTGKKVTPDKLYMATPTQRFMKTCKEKNVEWAVFSDKYGVIFPQQKIEWYNKHPDSVTENEFKELLDNFNKNLKDYDEVWFYYNPGRFHNLYYRLIKKCNLKINCFTHIQEIR
ncbi:MAG: hypothetical protein ACP5UL_05180 [Thermoplasmata archaeon]